MTKSITGLRAVIVSNLVSVGDVVLSFSVAAITGSSVMVSQGLQGLADLTTTMLLLLGVTRSNKKATSSHPFGYGRELFFWVLISSLFAFVVSGALAIFLAIRQLGDDTPVESVYIAFATLLFGLCTNGFSLSFSFKRLKQRANGRPLIAFIRKSSLVETKMTLLVDAMGTLSAALGLLALGLYQITGDAVFDSAGALIMGVLIASGAVLVIIDLHDLIIGRSPSQHVIDEISKTAKSHKHVQEVLDLRATPIGSEKLLVILELHFADDLTTDDIEVVTDEVKQMVIDAVPQVSHVQIEVESPE